MSLYTELRHPGADIGQAKDPEPSSTGYTRFNAGVAAWVTARIGSMWTVYICLAVTVIWMVLGSRQVLGFDPYPYPFLLFLGNVVQLLLIFVILLGQQVLGRSADRRAMRTYDYAEAIVVDCEQIQNHLIAQDALLGTRTGLPGTPSGLLGSQAGLLGVRGQRRPEAGYLAGSDAGSMAGADAGSMAGAGVGSMAGAGYLAGADQPDELSPAAGQRISFNAALAAWLTGKVGTMTACYLAVIFQAVWMVTGQVFGFDRYPYLFLLFLSSLIQLILMFVVMVGQQVIGQAAEHRAAQTYLNARAVLRACEGLQGHLRAQDLAILRIVGQLRQRADQQP